MRHTNGRAFAADKANRGFIRCSLSVAEGEGSQGPNGEQEPGTVRLDNLLDKHPLFERFVRPAPGDSADLLKAGMGSFFQPHQAASASEFGLRYFEVLSEVVREQELEYATRGFARLLVPHAIASPALIAAAEAALERARGTPILERVLLEETDEMARAVRLRASGAPQ